MGLLKQQISRHTVASEATGFSFTGCMLLGKLLHLPQPVSSYKVGKGKSLSSIIEALNKIMYFYV